MLREQIAAHGRPKAGTEAKAREKTPAPAKEAAPREVARLKHDLDVERELVKQWKSDAEAAQKKAAELEEEIVRSQEAAKEAAGREREVRAALTVTASEVRELKRRRDEEASERASLAEELERAREELAARPTVEVEKVVKLPGTDSVEYVADPGKVAAALLAGLLGGGVLGFVIAEFLRAFL